MDIYFSFSCYRQQFHKTNGVQFARSGFPAVLGSEAGFAVAVRAGARTGSGTARAGPAPGPAPGSDHGHLQPIPHTGTHPVLPPLRPQRLQSGRRAVRAGLRLFHRLPGLRCQRAAECRVPQHKPKLKSPHADRPQPNPPKRKLNPHLQLSRTGRLPQRLGIGRNTALFSRQI